MKSRPWAMFILLAFLLIAGHLAPHQDWFHGHEDNNLMGGWMIAHGGAAYRDFITHHTPFAYWWASLAALFGHELVYFRLAVALFYILALAVLFEANRRSARPFSFGLFVLFVTFGHVIYMGHLLTADGLFAFAALVPFYHFWRYDAEHRMRWRDWLASSIFMLVSVLSTLAAAYPMLLLAAGFVVKYFRFEPHPVRRLPIVAAIVLAPALVILTYFVATESLDDFYQQVFVTSVYYYRNDTGFASYSPAVAPIVFLASNAAQGIGLLLEFMLMRYGAIECALAWSNALLVMLLFGRARWAMALTYLAYLVMLMLRKQSEMHYEAPYDVQSLWAAAWVLGPVGVKLGEMWRAYREGSADTPAGRGTSLADALRIAGAALLLVLLARTYGEKIVADPPEQLPSSEIAQTVARLTSPDDRIATLPGIPQIYMEADRRPAMRAFAYAWWLDQIPEMIDEVVAAIEQQRPAVVVIGWWQPPTGSFAWRTFADEIRGAIRRNYQPLAPGEPMIYARNSSYYEMLGRYERTKPRPLVEVPNGDTLPIAVLKDSAVTQRFTVGDRATSAKIELLVSATRRSDVTVEIAVGEIDRDGRERILARDRFRSTRMRYYPGGSARSQWHAVRLGETPLEPGRRYFVRVASPAAHALDAFQVLTVAAADRKHLGEMLYGKTPLGRTACIRVSGLAPSRPRGVYPAVEQSLARKSIPAPTVRQTWTFAEPTTVSAVSILLGRDSRATADPACRFTLLARGQAIFSEPLAAPAADREWRSIAFPAVALEAGDTLTLAFDAESAATSPALRLWTAGTDIRNEGDLIFRGNKIDDELCFKFYEADHEPSGLPDVSLAAFDFEPAAPASIASSAPIRLFVRVENRGTTPTPPCWIEFYAKPQNLSKPPAFLADSVLTPALQPGESWEQWIERKVYPLDDGLYSLAAVADRTAEICESNEENNRFEPEAKSLLLVAPGEPANLVVDRFEIEDPVLHPARPARLNGFISNAGKAPAGRFVVALWAARDPEGNGPRWTLADPIAIERLAPNAIVDLSTATCILRNDLPPGEFYIGCTADAREEVAESKEWDNTVAVGPIPIQP